jgi:hypothetical protein
VVLADVPAGGSAHQAALRNRRACDSLLHQPEEEHPACPRPATVEPEGELVEVGVEMGVLHFALVRAKQPSSEATLRGALVASVRAQLARSSTAGAVETDRPPEASYVVQACCLGFEPGVELLEGSRVVDAGHRFPIVAQTETLHLVAGGVKCIPHFPIIMRRLR